MSRFVGHVPSNTQDDDLMIKVAPCEQFRRILRGWNHTAGLSLLLQVCTRSLRMRCNRKDSDLLLLWPVAPKDAIGAKGLVLSVSFEDFLVFVVGIRDAVVFVGVQSRMTRVLFQLRDGLMYLLKEPLGFR